ncbi:unnamed protein product [Durusdinium trenchii]|uniref:Uncharacterized protein n=2 Tax=Durusdinium trenchii TaxID=1381693 RepID=A0ABP0HKP4_9DINO
MDLCFMFANVYSSSDLGWTVWRCVAKRDLNVELQASPVCRPCTGWCFLIRVTLPGCRERERRWLQCTMWWVAFCCAKYFNQSIGTGKTAAVRDCEGQMFGDADEPQSEPIRANAKG